LLLNKVKYDLGNLKVLQPGYGKAGKSSIYRTGRDGVAGGVHWITDSYPYANQWVPQPSFSDRVDAYAGWNRDIDNPGIKRHVSMHQEKPGAALTPVWKWGLSD